MGKTKELDSAERVKDLEEFFELYSRFTKTGLKLTSFVVFEDKMLGVFLHRVRNGQIKTSDEDRKKLLELGLLNEEHILKLEGKIPKKEIRKPGTAANEIIMILNQMRKIVDISAIPKGAVLSDILTEKQIDKIRNKTGLNISSAMRIKQAINGLKFGSLYTNDKHRKELKELGIIEDKHIKKLEGKISRRKKSEKDKVLVKEDNKEKRKIASRNSVPEKMMRILLSLDEMGIDASNIRQADTLKKHIGEKRLAVLKEKSEIEDIGLDFRIGMYIDNIRQGHIKTDELQRKTLMELGVLNEEHISKLEKKDKLSMELKKAISEIEAIDIEEEEIKNELSKLKAREKELQERLKGIEEDRSNAQKNLQELNSKDTQNKSR